MADSPRYDQIRYGHHCFQINKWPVVVLALPPESLLLLAVTLCNLSFGYSSLVENTNQVCSLFVVSYITIAEF